MPQVSVIIPAYNAMNYLPETMASVLNQTFTDFEVIVVDDGSTDETAKWVDQIADNRVQLVSQANQGLAGARNTGISHAQSQYLAFLDADDIWQPAKLARQVDVLAQNPDVGLVYTWVAYINQQGQPTGKVFAHTVEGHVWETLIVHNIVECGSVAMVRRECFATCGVFDRNLGSYVEDWDMWLRIAPHYPFKVVQEVLVNYRQRSTSASKNWPAMAQSFQMAIAKAFATAPQHLQYLQGRSYGFANLCLAWKPLQSLAKDYQKSAEFRDLAVAYYPRLRFCGEYMRLSMAIAAMRWLGVDNYQQLLGLFHNLRQRTATIKSNIL